MNKLLLLGLLFLSMVGSSVDARGHGGRGGHYRHYDRGYSYAPWVIGSTLGTIGAVAAVNSISDYDSAMREVRRLQRDLDDKNREIDRLRDRVDRLERR